MIGCRMAMSSTGESAATGNVRRPTVVSRNVTCGSVCVVYVRLCVRAWYLAADHDGPHGGVRVGVLPESVAQRDDV